MCDRRTFSGEGIAVVHASLVVPGRKSYSASSMAAGNAFPTAYKQYERRRSRSKGS